MRYRFLTLFLGLGLASLQADDGTDNFYMLAQSCIPEKEGLEVWPYDDSILWLNNVRQNTHDAGSALVIKPGDILITGSPLIWDDGKPKHSKYRDFCRYRLDKFAAQRAYFTLWLYSSIRTQLDEKSWKCQPGALQFTGKFELDLTRPNGLLVDYGPNHVELSWQKPSRAK